MEISILDYILSSPFITSMWIFLQFLLAIFVVYSFFYRYFSLKECNKEKNFLANIMDCIYDTRIESAIDMCKRVDLPEARIIRRGLEKIEKSSFEIFISMKNQRELEILEVKKGLSMFGFSAKFILLNGLLGTFIVYISLLLDGGDILNNPYFHTLFLPLLFGLFFAGVFYFFEWILVLMIDHIEIHWREKEQNFLGTIIDIK